MMNVIHKIPLALMCLLVPALISAQAPAPDGIPADMHSAGLNCIEMVFREEFRGAEEEAKKIIKSYPDHPAGYFFMAAVADAWMVRHQSSRREAEFYRYCDQAVEKAEKMLASDPNNDWARFFMGGADGYKGTYEARYERYIPAFRFGWKGVSVFMKMASSGSKNPDINFGIGTYDYWRSALMKLLWWMPGVDDKRAVGIEKLKNVMRGGVYTRAAASSVLMDIYINENRFEEALAVANEASKKYPRSLIYMWGRASALQSLKRHDEAVTAYRAILTKCEKDQNSNYYNVVKARVGAAKSLHALGRNQEAVEQATAALEYQLSKEIKKRLDSTLKEAETIKKRVGSKGGGDGGDGVAAAN